MKDSRQLTTSSLPCICSTAVALCVYEEWKIVPDHLRTLSHILRTSELSMIYKLKAGSCTYFEVLRA